MAQIKIPVEFPLQVVLLNSIIEKNNTPGFESPLTEQGLPKTKLTWLPTNWQVKMLLPRKRNARAS